MSHYEHFEKRIDKAARFFGTYLSSMSCPVCQHPMERIEQYSILCVKGHCFNISKQGYLSLSNSSSSTQYSKELFQARAGILNHYYGSTASQIADVIDKWMPEKQGFILDAGCGEGYYIRQLSVLNQTRRHAYAGVDISKEGISQAAKTWEHSLWCVADLAKLPFQSGVFDVILNILTPSNYNEFERVLSSNGFVVKLVPGPEYLQEIRQIINPDKKIYDNQHVVQHFQRQMMVLDEKTFAYTCHVPLIHAKDFIQMTPLSSHLSDVQLNDALNNWTGSVTIDFHLLVGRSKH